MTTRSKLKATDPKAAEPSKPKILIYGKPGAGKTWASLDFPGCYYIDTEGGADLEHYTDKLKASGGAYLGPDQGSLDFKEILEQVKALTTEQHHYKTLVIDSISKIFSLEIAREAERLGDANAYGADKKPAVGYMRRLVSWLTRLDMNVILIAHEKSEWGLDDKKQRVEIGSTFDCWDKLEYELHLCLNIVKLTENKRIAKVRKTRLKEFADGAVFNWSYEEFAKRYGRHILEKDAVQVVLATPDQLKELDALLAVVKIPEEMIAGWFKKNDVESFDEMKSANIGLIIDHLKSKITVTSA